MAAKQTIIVAVDGQELAGVHAQQWETHRREITETGALGVANNTGVIGIRLNGSTALNLWIHEDASGKVVIDMLDARGALAGRVYPEADGLVPARPGASSRRRPDRRFGPPEGVR